MDGTTSCCQWFSNWRTAPNNKDHCFWASTQTCWRSRMWCPVRASTSTWVLSSKRGGHEAFDEPACLKPNDAGFATSPCYTVVPSLAQWVRKHIRPLYHEPGLPQKQWTKQRRQRDGEIPTSADPRLRIAMSAITTQLFITMLKQTSKRTFNHALDLHRSQTPSHPHRWLRSFRRETFILDP